ncbi:unnamed protein product [Acanthoscelides obtectus]|uniref:Uncharacterized protein n=1 Tax=Acanthoscelides obtectus TaxID=200917 RepID=A0A9P0MBI9_ACAOB|nr:unnamed protein product [Acanthoscelides obtectus]CAK1666810.1 hypothetical protein AOBTE_LOCUS25500 [Acanthoscelides obtectus]
MTPPTSLIVYVRYIGGDISQEEILYSQSLTTGTTSEDIEVCWLSKGNILARLYELKEVRTAGSSNLPNQNQWQPHVIRKDQANDSYIKKILE